MSASEHSRKPGTPAAERGQALVLFAAGLVALLALLALSVDVGLMVFTRGDLQKTADAAALAGAQDLPDTAVADSIARDYVTTNHGNADATVEFGSTGSTTNTIRVRADREVDLFFGGLVGIDNVDISAEATVEVASYSGGDGLLPWGLVASNDSNSTLLQNECFDGWENGEPTFKQNMDCQIKFGAGGNSGGDFGALDLDSSGGSGYRHNIAHGSDNRYKKGDKIKPETGDMAGPTKQGVKDRFDMPVPSGCAGHNRDDVLKTNGDGSVSIREGCEESPRIGIVPVVDRIENPKDTTILGFAFVYLAGEVPGGGKDSTVAVEFVEFTSSIPGGVYEGDNLDGTTIARLIE